MKTCSLSGLWQRPEAVYAPLEDKAKSFLAITQTSTRGVVTTFLALLILLGFISIQWIKGRNFTLVDFNTEQALSSHHAPPHKPAPKPIILNCRNQTVHICHSSASSPSAILSPVSSSPLTITQEPSLSCPDYFRWIHEDLRTWKSTGITRDAVERARRFANFRLVVLDGRVFVEQYGGAFQTRDVFTLWGILQLVLRRYTGRVPDLDLMFHCNDTPSIKLAEHHSSPQTPLFGYSKNDETLDIVFPDWSFWGWAEVNIKPWEVLIKELEEGNKRVEWRDRKPHAYWKGNPSVSESRMDLMKCNVSKHREWNARLYAQNWKSEIEKGFTNSNLATQCDHRYKIFVEGRAWSVSDKYILACDSPALFVTTHFHDFYSRGLMPSLHYWPIREDSKCSSIKFAVDWGNEHQTEAQAMGKAGSRFVREEVKMDYVYDYILHLLREYAALLRYKPAVPEKAAEFCLESMACPAAGAVKELLMESVATRTRDADPCRMPPPFDPEDVREMLDKKANAIKQVELLETKARN